MWDDRFTSNEFLFGTNPAVFLEKAAAGLPAGSDVLCVADGEGRNSVFLAEQGHHVTAFDASVVGVEKARQLAERKDVRVSYHVAQIEDWDWTLTYDVVVGIFIQFMPPEMRDAIFREMRAAVKPGGLLLLHGYAPRQVDYGTGGPPNADNMYTTELLRDAFGDWDVLSLTDYDADIQEGKGHAGRSALVDLIARKPTD